MKTLADRLLGLAAGPDASWATPADLGELVRVRRSTLRRLAAEADDLDTAPAYRGIGDLADEIAAADLPICSCGAAGSPVCVRDHGDDW